MFQSRVFTLSIFTNNSEIHFLITRTRQTREILQHRHRSIDIQILTKKDIERFMTQFRDRSVQDTF